MSACCAQVTWNSGQQQQASSSQRTSDPVEAWCRLASGSLLARHAGIVVQYAQEPTLAPMGAVFVLPGTCCRAVQACMTQKPIEYFRS